MKILTISTLQQSRGAPPRQLHQMWESSVVTFNPSVTKVCIQMCMIFFFIKDDLFNLVNEFSILFNYVTCRS
jgi:hypothetical protein